MLLLTGTKNLVNPCNDGCSSVSSALCCQPHPPPKKKKKRKRNGVGGGGSWLFVAECVTQMRRFKLCTLTASSERYQFIPVIVTLA